MKNGIGHWRIRAGEQSCNRYTGMYMDDLKHGHGEFIWEIGAKYLGHYVKDKKQGYGVMTWPDGSIYSGFWHKGKQHGLGILVNEKGQSRAGYFHNNIFVKPLESKQEFDEFKRQHKGEIPAEFVKKMGVHFEQRKEGEEVEVNVQIKKNIKEDKATANQLNHILEMANAPIEKN